MKILYVSQFFYPEITAGAFRAFDNATIWEKNNVDVTVYTANPNYPKGEIYAGYTNNLISKECIDNLDVIRGKVYIRKNTKKLSRGLISLSFLFFSIINIIFNRKKVGKNYDVVLGSSGSIFAALAAYLFSLTYKAKFILEIRDITYIQMLATMSNKKSILYKVIRFLELFLCKKAEKIVVVTEGFRKQLIEDGVDERKIEVVYNGIVISQSEEIIKDNSKNEFVLAYAGTLGISQGIIELIDFYNNLNIKNKKLLLIGEGAEKDKILDYIKINNIKDIELLPAVSKNKLNDLYKEIDLCVVKLKYNDYFTNTMPSKVFDLMSRGMPILYLGPKGEVSNLIDESNCGLALCSFNNKDNVKKFMSFYDRFNNICEFKSYLNKLANNGVKCVNDNFNRKTLALKYLKILNDLIRNKI